MRQCPSEHWVTTSQSFIPTLRILLCTIVGSQAPCQAIEEDSDLELCCP